MIPLKDYNPTSHFPVLTVALIIANIAAFVRDRLTGHLEEVLIPTRHGAVTATHFVGGLSDRFALVPADLLLNPLHEWITVFTSMFLHGNWLHIGSNMLYLWIFGNNIEDRLGPVRFLLFYFISGGVAAAAQIASAPLSTIPMVGASGAVAGVMGAYLVLYPRARILTLIPIFIFFTTVELPAFVIIGYWALLQFLNANWLGSGEMQGGGVAYFAHLGGFVAGTIMILIAGGARGRRRFY